MNVQDLWPFAARASVSGPSGLFIAVPPGAGRMQGVRQSPSCLEGRGAAFSPGALAQQAVQAALLPTDRAVQFTYNI